MSLAVLTLLAACGLNPARVPEQPVFATEREVVARHGPVRFGVAGATGPDSAPVIADIAEAVRHEDLAFVVLLGEQVPRSSVRTWQDLAERWAPVTGAGASLVPVVGRGERRGDGDLVGFSAAYDRRGWWWFDLLTDGTPWRLVMLECGQDAMGPRWAEQQYALPRAIDGARSLLLFLPAPAVVTATDPDPDAARLLDAISDHAPPGATSVVFQGGVATHEVHLPGGPWGDAFVVAGNSGVPGVAAGPSALDPPLDPGETGQPAAIARQGWWRVEVHGREIDLAFRMRQDDGTLRPTARIHHDPTAGWHPAAADTTENDLGDP